MDRSIGLKALSTVLKQPKNCELMEKYIFEKMDDDTYNWCIYQIIGLILSGHTVKEVGQQVKKGQIGWKSSTYEKVSEKIEEFDNYLVKPVEVVEGVVECGKCGSKKTWSVQKQIRGSDEPMTTFSKCVECGNQWSYSG